MRKILLGVDAVNPDMDALDFACYLARLTKSKVTGVFLENLVAAEIPVVKQMQGIVSIDWQVDEKSPGNAIKMGLVEKNISFFKEACLRRSVTGRVHRDKGVPANELIEESRFADVIVVNSDTSFNKRYEGAPTEFVRDILKKAECPVIIAPGKFDAMDEIIFTYDKSASSVFAIKQFTYLFPELQNRKVSVVQVNAKGEWHGSDKRKFEEWLNDHYTDFHFEVEKGDSDAKLFEYLFKRKNIMIVMGAYGRNAVSHFFKPSHADLLLTTVTQPIFIAHF
ncbi:MAG: hypothetical protein ABI472_06070 [Ginsengibacter sp.]